MTPRQDVNEAISRERAYQDQKWGTIEQHPHTVPEWLLIMEAKVADAKKAWLSGTWAEQLGEVVQAVATGVACLEQHGYAVRHVRDKEKEKWIWALGEAPKKSDDKADKNLG